VYGKCPLAFLGVAVGVAGFASELTRACSWRDVTRLVVAAAVGCVALALNLWLLLGGSCLSLWWQGLSERSWFLLQDACEAI
jgi:hypothetical protein